MNCDFIPSSKLVSRVALGLSPDHIGTAGNKMTMMTTSKVSNTNTYFASSFKAKVHTNTKSSSNNIPRKTYGNKMSFQYFKKEECVTPSSKQKTKIKKEEQLSSNQKSEKKTNFKVYTTKKKENAINKINSDSPPKPSKYFGSKQSLEPEKNCKWNLKHQRIINLNMSKEEQSEENPRSNARSNSATERQSIPFCINSDDGNDVNPYLAAGSAVKRKEMKDKRIYATNISSKNCCDNNPQENSSK